MPLIIILASFAILSIGFLGWTRSFEPVSKDKTPKTFIIPKGYSASQIGNRLKEQGFIKSALTFKFYVQLTGKAGKIQSGEYIFSSNLSLFQIVDELIKGPSGVWVTLPEGLRKEQILEKFLEALAKDKEEEKVFAEEFLRLTLGKEGFLFPDTYLFPKSAGASLITNQLETNFNKKVTSEMKEKVKKSALSLDEVITLASLIERETRGEEERPIVAGILLKRLEKGWPLQVDATVQYALDSVKCRVQIRGCKFWEPLSNGDKLINSRYNTYQFGGLPPGPIANPGLSSISAAIQSVETSYWYYLHDQKGVIHYAETLEEHNANIQKYLAGD